MHHLAILRKAKIKKRDNLLGDILFGKKTIESRWYVNKIAPWNRIKKGDTVYLKESGMSVTAKANVKKVIQYNNLNSEIIKRIIKDFGDQIAPNTSYKDWLLWAKKNDNKRYCILIFLKDVSSIEPFDIDKTGYGISSAWITLENIDNIKKC